MKICGVDYSINSPGIIKATLNDNLDIVDVDYLAFSDIKKTAELNSKIIYYQSKSTKKENKQFKNNFEKYIWFKNQIFDFIQDCEYCAMEGYAFAKKGLVFNIAESTMTFKLAVYENKISLRIYNISLSRK